MSQKETTINDIKELLSDFKKDSFIQNKEINDVESSSPIDISLIYPKYKDFEKIIEIFNDRPIEESDFCKRKLTDKFWDFLLDGSNVIWGNLVLNMLFMLINIIMAFPIYFNGFLFHKYHLIILFILGVWSILNIFLFMLFCKKDKQKLEENKRIFETPENQKKLKEYLPYKEMVNADYLKDLLKSKNPYMEKEKNRSVDSKMGLMISKKTRLRYIHEELQDILNKINKIE